MRGVTDLGMDPHKDSADAKDGPETYTEGMVPSFLSQTMAPKKYQKTLCFWREEFFML
jgi:hypothetical protein